MLRAKKEILKDYLSLLNDEKKLGYSSEEMDKKINDPRESQITEKLLLNELYGVEEYQGQTVSTERAFYLWCDIIIRYDFKTGERIWNVFVKDQFLIVERHKLSCYMAARGHGKTFFIALYVSFKMFLAPYFDVGYCSNISLQVRRFFKTFRSIIDGNEFLLEKKDVRGINTKETPWGQKELEYNNGTMEGLTMGSTPRGGHFNLAIGDDPLREDKKYPYERVVDYFQGVFKQTIYRKKGRYIIVGTPWDPDDLFHTLMNEKLDKNNRPLGKICVNKISSAGYYCKIFPGIIDENKQEVLIPELFSYEWYINEKKAIGDIRFNREIMCRCVSYRNSLISSHLFRSCCDEKLSMIQTGDKEKKYIIFADSATSDAPTADYVAISVWEDNQKENLFIFRHLFHGKGIPITDPTGGADDQAHKVLELYKYFNKALVIIEKNNAGIALIQAATALGVPDIIEHYTHSVSTGKPTVKPGKANDVIDYVEGLKEGIVKFPSNPEDNYTVDTLEKVKIEHLNFGVKQGRSGEVYEALAGKDDIFDSCWGAFKFRGDQADTLPFAITIPG